MGAFLKSVAIAAAIAFAGVAQDGGAATRYWMLEGVTFKEDGAAATGSFGYDDVTGVVSSWNVRVGGSASRLPFTYMPGNSTAWAGEIGVAPEVHFRVIFYANAGSGGAERELRLSVPTELVASPTVFPLLTFDPIVGGYYSAECCSLPSRGILAGSLVQVPFPPPIGLVDVVEFHHAGLDHYFITGDANEVQVLDLGTIPGWTRTGGTFQANAIGSSPGPATNPVCRYFGVPVPGIGSHFYSANGVECYQVFVKFGTVWQVESDNVFQVDVPDAVGACPGGTIPVYRLFNNQADANHRYTTSLVVRAQMEAAGWIREGFGPGGVVMCAVAP